MVVCAFDPHRIQSRPKRISGDAEKSHPRRSSATQVAIDIGHQCGAIRRFGVRPRAVSLYFTERQLVVRHFLGLLLILAVATLALRTARLFYGTPTAAVGAHRLSSECQSGYHRRSGRFVVKNPLDLAHYVRIQFRDKLEIMY